MCVGAVDLSFVVVVHNMPEQAWNTIQSLLPSYQRDGAAVRYEVVIVENRSTACLDQHKLNSLPQNFRYILRDEPGISPAAALHHGVQQAQGQYLAIMIDGARMLSNGVLAGFQMARGAHSAMLLTIPGYYLSAAGAAAEQSAGQDCAADEQRWLADSNWQSQPERLFERAVFSNGNRCGLLRPFMEATVFIVHRDALAAAGGVDTGFQLRGGGALILDLFRRLGLNRELKYLVLAGEGNFHQYHGGVSTRKGEDRDALVREFKAELDARWEGGYKGLSRESVLLGKWPNESLKFIRNSCEQADERNRNFIRQGKAIWPDADALGEYHAEAISCTTDSTATTGESRSAKPEIASNSAPLKLSVVVIVYKMPRQAMNTLKSLTPAYQQGVEPGDYEVIVVENQSSAELNPVEVAELGPNFRYVHRAETRPTPVYASNHGLAEARGEHICFMIDGARMLSPRVLRYSLDALAMNPRSLVATPGYHIGEQDQKFSTEAAHDEALEIELLKGIDWFNHGYRLFDISCFSGANDKGFFHPLMESNCIAFHRTLLDTVGGLHEGYQTPGGGSVNLDFYRQLALLEDSPLVILAGEGSFHQFHGGVTTMQQSDLDDVLQSHRDEMKRIRGSYYKAVRKEPHIYGVLSSHSTRFMHESTLRGESRYKRFARSDEDAWDS